MSDMCIVGSHNPTQLASGNVTQLGKNSHSTSTGPFKAYHVCVCGSAALHESADGIIWAAAG